LAKRLSKGIAGLTDSKNNDINSSNSMELDNQNESSDHEDGYDPKLPQSLGQNSRRAYLRELKKVIDTADVVLHVIDARDPTGTRSSAIEEMVLSDHRKKLVFVLNKADLVPRNILAGWLLYLRQYAPCIPFKCNLQTQKNNLGRASGKISKLQESALNTQQAVGAEELLGLLKNYCRLGNDSIKSTISVGIVGFPNVGKSSLVNSLTRQRAVQVSSTPGFTKQLQEVILDKNIRLIDSPGIVFADGDTVATSLRNCVNVDSMTDVITPVQAILQKCPRAYLMQLYSISRYEDNDVMNFLALVARATGRLKKGGVANIDAAARGVIQDWNTGKIKYYTLPPAVTKKSSVSESAIVSSFSKQLDIDNLQDSDIRVLDALDASDDASFFHVEHIAEKLVEEKVEEIPKISKVTISSSAKATESNRAGNEQSVDLRKLQKKTKKKSEKDNRRLTSKAEGNDNGNEEYSFETDFQYN
jgi:nuclear GTP-binding protein